MAPVRARPSWWWLALCPLLGAMGVYVGVAAGFDEARRIAAGFELLGDDGTGTIRLERGAEATVWAVSLGDGDDSLERRPAASVSVVGPTGTAVNFSERAPTDGTTTFSANGERGLDLGTFRARDAGTYRVSVRYPLGPASGASLGAGVGQLDLSRTVARVLRPIGFGALASIAWLIVVVVARARSTRRARRAPDVQGPITFG